MNTVSIWTYDTPVGAEAALRALERWQHQGWVGLEDVSVVAWPAGARRPRTYQVGTVHGTAALTGAFWGLLFGTLFLLPLVDATPAPLGTGAGLAHLGLPDGWYHLLVTTLDPQQENALRHAFDAEAEV